MIEKRNGEYDSPSKPCHPERSEGAVQLSGITDKIVIPPERAVILNEQSSRPPEADRDLPAPGPWPIVHGRVIIIRSLPKELTSVEEMLHTQFSIGNVLWNSGWGIRFRIDDLIKRQERKEEIPFAFLFATLAFFAVKLRHCTKGNDRIP